MRLIVIIGDVRAVVLRAARGRARLPGHCALTHQFLLPAMFGVLGFDELKERENQAIRDAEDKEIAAKRSLERAREHYIRRICACALADL